MTVEKVKIDPGLVASGLQIGTPLVRLSLDGRGCPCGCSPGDWMFVSDGETALKVTLTQEETVKIRTNEVVELT